MIFETWLARAGIIVISTLSAGCPPIPEITAVGPEMGPPTCDEAALASGSSHLYVINLLWMAGVEGDAPPLDENGSPSTCEAGSIALQFSGVTAFGGP